ncbi:MAG: DUF5593 domain-containing protein [Gordonia polyisoprenivorans]|nr:DUF5593 domain-containing protein [Gordonia polyisoprenivorans]
MNFSTRETAGRWILAESLDPAIDMTVVSLGGEPRDFTSLERVVRGELRAAGVEKVTRDMADDVMLRFLDVRRYAVPVTRQIADTDLTVICLPVIGPDRFPHGVQGWIGDRRTYDPPDERPAAGVVLDYATGMITQPIESIRLSGVPDSEYVREVSLAEIIDRGDGVEATELIALTHNPPVPGDSLKFQVNVPHSAGYSMRWQVTIRSRNDSQTVGSWWLWEDITSDTNRPTTPPIERAAAKEALQEAGIYMAVLHPESATISHWLNDVAAPWIQWEFNQYGHDVFHPDDRAKIAALADVNSADELVVRTRYTAKPGYLETRLRLSPYPGLTASRRLLYARAELVGDPRDPLPLEEGFNPGHRSQERSYRLRTSTGNHLGDQPPETEPGSGVSAP